MTQNASRQQIKIKPMLLLIIICPKYVVFVQGTWISDKTKGSRTFLCFSGTEYTL